MKSLTIEEMEKEKLYRFINLKGTFNKVLRIRQVNLEKQILSVYGFMKNKEDREMEIISITNFKDFLILDANLHISEEEIKKSKIEHFMKN